MQARQQATTNNKEKQRAKGFASHVGAEPGSRRRRKEDGQIGGQETSQMYLKTKYNLVLRSYHLVLRYFAGGPLRVAIGRSATNKI